MEPETQYSWHSGARTPSGDPQAVNLDRGRGLGCTGNGEDKIKESIWEVLPID